MKKLFSLVIIFICAYASVYAQCTVPTSVTIAGPAAFSICEGSQLTLSGNTLVPGIPQNASFTYSWKKNLSGSTVDLVGPTDIVISANTTTNVPNYTGITGAPADAGTYVLRVEDGNSGNASCYTEASVVVIVNPKPIITSATTGTICSGVAQNHLITSDIPATYTWSRAAVAGITSAAVRNMSSNPITETLTNSTEVTPIVRYVITPTSTTGSCVGTAFNYDVTVDPKPTITSVATGAICSGTAQNYAITSNVPSTYLWTRATVTGITNAAITNMTANQITETLTNVTTTATVVRYNIVPTSFNGCVGKTFNYDVTIANEIPPVVSITTNPGTTICTGTSVTFKATPTNGGTSPSYSWQSSINGLLAPTTDTYTSNSLVDGEVITATMTSNLSCAVPKTAAKSISMHVLSGSGLPIVAITADKTSICAGNPVTFQATATNVIVTPSYEWFVESGGNQVSQGAPSSTNYFTTSALQTNDKVFVKITSNDACASSTPVSSTPLSIQVNLGISAGTIGSDQTICYGATPAALTELTASNAASPTYSWEQSMDAITWAPATGVSNGSGFIPQGTYTSDIYLRRVVIDLSVPAPCNVVTGNTIRITARPPVTAGAVSSDETICVGTVPSTITETAHTTGGTGIYTYQWESSIQSDGPYASVSNATNASYSPDMLNSTMYFRRMETSGSCGSVYSNEVAKTVVLTTLPTINIADPGKTCNGDIVLFKCQATNVGLTPTYNFYVNDTIAASFSSVSTNFNLIKPLKKGAEVWVELISSSSCASVSTIVSNKVLVDLGPCTVSNSVYTTNNVPILLQQYVSNSVPNLIDYTYFWSITDGFISTNVITGPNQISPGQQNVTYSVPNQAGFTYVWIITGGTITSGQGTNTITVDWDNVVGTKMARTTATDYSVSVTETNQLNKSKTTTMELNTTTTAVALPLAQSGIQFYPNPTADGFNIVMPQSGTLVQYSITDLSGTAVANGTFTSTGGAEKIVANFNAGLYQVVLTYNETVTCLRLNKVQ